MVDVDNGYTTTAVIKHVLDVNTSDDDDHLVRAINAASRMIDEHCGRRFWRDLSDRTAYLTARDVATVVCGPEPEVADVASVTSVEVDTAGFGDYVAVPSGFHLSPRSMTHGVAQRIIRTSGCWPAGRERVKVVGLFGIDGPPSAVEEACIMQASRLFKRATEAPMGSGMINMANDGVAIRPSRYLDGDVEQLLRPWRLNPVLVG